MARIAFFDLDKTILSVNSGSLVFRRLRREGFIDARTAASSALVGLLYHFGLRGADAVIRSGTALCRGRRHEELASWYRALWDEEVAHTVRPAARQSLQQHREAGDRLVLITSSTPFMAKLAADALSMDEALAPGMVAVDGVLTGECEEPLCTGVGKIHHAQLAADRAGVTLGECVFYSDSYSDLPLLEACGERVVVDPDQRLRRLANARRWPIASW